jgi:hypothetical protein
LHRAVPLLSSLIVAELFSIKSGGLLFGASNATLEVLLECVRLYAGDYLKTMLQPTVANVSNEIKNYQPSTEEGVGNLVNEIYNIFTTLVHTSKSLPHFFKNICEKVAETSSADSTMLISSFIVGRVLPSALQEPHRFGLLKDPPIESVRSSLHFIVQFFHIFSANQEFPPNHAQAAYLNEAISVWRAPTAELYKEFAAPKKDSITNGSAGVSGCCSEDEADVDFKCIETDISNIWGKLKDHYQAICIQLFSINDIDTIQPLTQLLTAFEPDPTPL